MLGIGMKIVGNRTPIISGERRRSPTFRGKQIMYPEMAVGASSILLYPRRSPYWYSSTSFCSGRMNHFCLNVPESTMEFICGYLVYKGGQQGPIFHRDAMEYSEERNLADRKK